MELRVPVLFLDMATLEEEREREEEALSCPPTTLFGEKPDSMIKIPIIQREENNVRGSLGGHVDANSTYSTSPSLSLSFLTLFLSFPHPLPFS